MFWREAAASGEIFQIGAVFRIVRRGVATFCSRHLASIRIINLGSSSCSLRHPTFFGGIQEQESNMSAIENRLADLGITLPEPPRPVASYLPAVQSGNLLMVSGQIPFQDGELLANGAVPSKVSIDLATTAARQCAINGLAVAKSALGGELERIRRVVRLGVFVQCDPGFDAQPSVANGASDFMVEVFGDAGRHARAAVGVNALPLDSAVEVEFVFEVE